MAEEEPEELHPCLWESKIEEGEWGEGTTDEGFPVGEVRFRRPPSICPPRLTLRSLTASSLPERRAA